MRAREMERRYNEAEESGDHFAAAHWAAALATKYANQSTRLAVVAMALAVVSLVLTVVGALT